MNKKPIKKPQSKAEIKRISNKVIPKADNGTSLNWDPTKSIWDNYNANKQNQQEGQGYNSQQLSTGDWNSSMNRNLAPIDDNGPAGQSMQNNIQGQSVIRPNIGGDLIHNGATPDYTDLSNSSNQNSNQQQPKAKHFSMSTPGTGDLVAAGLEFADSMLPGHQDTKNLHTRQFGSYNANSQGTGSQAIYDDGGVVMPANYRKHNIQVSYDNNMYNDNTHIPYSSQPHSQTTQITPINNNNKTISFDKQMNSNGTPAYYLPKFNNFSNGDAMNSLRDLPSNFNGIPVNNSPDTLRNSYNGAVPGSNTNNWTPTTDKSIAPIDFSKVNQTWTSNNQPARFQQGYDSQGNIKESWNQDRPYEMGGFVANRSNEDFSNFEHAEDGINIKKSHRGRFTAYKKRTGETTEEALHSKDPHIRQMANFARNAKHFKHDDGGQLDNNGQLQMLGDGNVQPISTNMYSNPMMQFNGPSHDNGGIPIQYGNKPVEVEGQETAFKDQGGNLQVLGNMKFPKFDEDSNKDFAGKKFKDIGKDIASGENKAAKIYTKSTDLVSNNDSTNPYQALAYNTGTVLADAASQKNKDLTTQKEALASIQNHMLDLSKATGIDPKKIHNEYKNGGTIAWEGKTINGFTTDTDNGIGAQSNDNTSSPGDDYMFKAINDAANKYNIDPNTFKSLIRQESGFDPAATSLSGAKGLLQFMPKTAKSLGLDPNRLNSEDPNDQVDQINAGAKYLAQQRDANGGDATLGLVAYNGGQKAIDFVKQQLNKKNITGQDWMNFMANRRNTNPTDKTSAWQNQTYDYVNSINGNDPNNQDDFRSQYYQGKTLASAVPIPWQNPDEPTLSKIPVNGIDNTGGNSWNPISPSDIPFRDPNTGQAINYNPNMQGRINPTRKKTSLADSNNLGISDFLSEIPYIFDRPTPVAHEHYSPDMYQPYQVSYQDQLNQNNSTFRNIGQQINDPGVLASLAGQKYNADNAVQANQFRTNQGISNDITNKNIGTINNARMTNLQLADQQYGREAQAKSNTDSRRAQALASISSKISANKLENNNIRLIENTSNFRPDDKLNMQYQGPNANFNMYGNGSNLGSNEKMEITRDKDGNPVRTITTILPNKQKQQQAVQASNSKWGGIFS